MLTVAPFAPEPPGIALRARMTGFAGFLRANGFGVGGDDSARVVETAAHVGIFDGEILRWSLKALLCGRGEEWRRFDSLFDAYFLPPNKRAFAESRSARTGPPAMAPASGDANRELPVAAPARTMRAPTMAVPSGMARAVRRRSRRRIFATSTAPIRFATSRR